MHGYIEHTIDYTLLLYIYYIYLYFPGCRCVCVCVQLHCNYCEILLQRIFYDGCCFLPSPSRFRSTFTSTSTVTLHVRKYYICYMLYARCYMYVWAGGAWLGSLCSVLGGWASFLFCGKAKNKTLFDGDGQQANLFSSYFLVRAFGFCLPLMIFSFCFHQRLLNWCAQACQEIMCFIFVM